VINAALMRRRSAKARPAVSLDEAPREEELPASERFADDGPNPEQVFASTEIREMISETSTSSRRCCARRLSCAKCRVIRRAKRPRSWESRKNTLKARLWRARHQLAERLGRRLRRMKDDMTGAMGDPECSYC